MSESERERTNECESIARSVEEENPDKNDVLD